MAGFYQRIQTILLLISISPGCLQVFCRQACSTVLLCALASAALTLPNTSRAPAHIAALPAASTNQSARSNTTTSITAPGATAAHSLPALQAATPAATQLAAAPTSPLQLLTHRGQSLFLTGMNLGNVQFLPFEGNPYGYTADQMRGILAGALRDIAATGSNSIRLWLHIDGSRSPAWGTKVSTLTPRRTHIHTTGLLLVSERSCRAQRNSLYCACCPLLDALLVCSECIFATHKYNGMCGAACRPCRSNFGICASCLRQSFTSVRGSWHGFCGGRHNAAPSSSCSSTCPEAVWAVVLLLQYCATRGPDIV